jgi:hypothetical protein
MPDMTLEREEISWPQEFAMNADEFIAWDGTWRLVRDGDLVLDPPGLTLEL